MSCTRSQIVAQAQSWLGCKESNGSHKKIIDVYNSHRPRARGYKLKYTDSWCSGFASACAIACNATDIIPTEVGCGKHIALFQKKGIWVENDAYVPLPGDYIFYDWSDDGKGENTAGASHVGIVEKVEDGEITVIEGNYSNSVKRRTLKVNGKYIRGYGVPMYDEEIPVAPKVEENPEEEATPATLIMRVLQKGDTGNDVLALQILLKGRGCNGNMNKKLDGIFGKNTRGAVILFQKKHGLPQTGAADTATWKVLLGAE